MEKAEKVKEIMKFIEDISSKGDYQCLEIAFLIFERSDLKHNDVNKELIEQVQKISDNYSSLLNENLNEDLEKVIEQNNDELEENNEELEME